MRGRSETRSPSNMMQELAGRFRQAGLNVFRHRRGMLFVSPIRVRPFVHAQAEVSPSVNAILEILAAAPRTNRKELFEKLIADVASEEVESRKLAFASDLRWLINEGYVIEFNDGSLDLPRGKAKPQESRWRPSLPRRCRMGRPPNQWNRQLQRWANLQYRASLRSAAAKICCVDRITRRRP